MYKFTDKVVVFARLLLFPVGYPNYILIDAMKLVRDPAAPFCQINIIELHIIGNRKDELRTYYIDFAEP
jgi:hypothetical protein